ncbi:MAG: hypothetical protein HQL78_00305 [Magnetococcales bacterium]|nr:hypothetical protein [Magnetococcales bacterium]MBF0418590.1 hypothetical protein [Magnetococcales bacterium]
MTDFEGRNRAAEDCPLSCRTHMNAYRRYHQHLGEGSMQINVKVEVTPLEARTFLGLPDVQPLQNEVLDKIKERMLSKMDKFESMFDPGKAVESYFSLYPQWLDAFKKFGANNQNNNQKSPP